MSKQRTRRDNAPNKTGPKPETLKVEGDWKKAIKKSLTKRKPSGGWPK